jgi:hypothetical protein
MDTITTQLTLGAPQVAGPLAVFPVHGPPAVLAYQAYATAIADGASVTELEGGAAVNRLLATNPTGTAMLLYEGEQVLGAQQDRAIDASVLVAPGARAEIAVSCVEQGRWDGRRHREAFRPAPHADDPSLRRTKRESALRSASQGLAGRPAQGEVWHEVGSRLRQFAAESGSARFGDLFDQRRGEIGALADDIEPQAGQVGALACVGGAPIALDVAGRPDVFATLHDRLVRGYALDALAAVRRRRGGDVDGSAPADGARAAAFLARVLTASRRPVDTPGMGEAWVLVGPGVVGGSLTAGGDLVTVSAFPASPTGGDRGPAPQAGGVARPSRRRPR